MCIKRKVRTVVLENESKISLLETAVLENELRILILEKVINLIINGRNSASFTVEELENIKKDSLKALKNRHPNVIINLKV